MLALQFLFFFFFFHALTICDGAHPRRELNTFAIKVEDRAEALRVFF